MDYVADINIFMLPDNSGYYLLGYTTSNDHSLVCKYLFSAPTNLGCQQTILFRGPFGATLLSSGDIFLPGYDTGTPVNLHFYKLTYGSTSVSWANQIVTSGGQINAGSSTSSSDNSKIYSLSVAFESGISNLYFMTFLSSDGSVSGSRYKSDPGVTGMYGSSLNGNYLLALIFASSAPRIVIINISTFSFTSKQFSGSVLSHIAIESYSGRWAYLFNL